MEPPAETDTGVSSFSFEEEGDGGTNVLRETKTASKPLADRIDEFMATLPESPFESIAHSMLKKYWKGWTAKAIKGGWKCSQLKAAEWYCASPKNWRQFLEDLRKRMVESEDVPAMIDGEIALEKVLCDRCNTETTDYDPIRLFAMTDRFTGLELVNGCKKCPTSVAEMTGGMVYRIDGEDRR